MNADPNSKSLLMLALGVVCGGLAVIPAYHLVVHQTFSTKDGAALVAALVVAGLAFVVRRRP